MFNFLNKTLEMEKSHGPYRDPKMREQSTNYSEFGPVGICIHIQEQYGELVKVKVWPALAESITQSNLVSANNNSKKNVNGYKCHGCGPDYHFFPKKPADFRGTSTVSNGNGETETPTNPKGSGGWKFIAPADINYAVTVNGLEYHFFSHCVFKRRSVRGFTTIRIAPRIINFLKPMEMIPYQPQVDPFLVSVIQPRKEPLSLARPLFLVI